MFFQLSKSQKIKIFKPAYFLASKFEAFINRGHHDGRTSTDFEDIIYILNNRTSIWKEIESSDTDVNQYLLYQFTLLIDNPYLSEWIGANLEFSEKSRIRYIIGNIRELVDKIPGTT